MKIGKAVIEFDCTVDEFLRHREASKLDGEKWTFKEDDCVNWNE